MHWHSLAFLISPLLAYVFGAASPGPANFATMTTSLAQGRRAGLIFALGVFSGSIFWGLLAILGLGAVMTLYSEALTTLKIIGGAYLLWLGIKSARSALRPSAIQSATSSGGSFRALFFSGLALHLTNPKPILTWTAVVSLGLQADAGIWHGLAIVAVCGLAGLVIFSTYAIVFSTQAAQRGFGRARRGIDGVLAVIYAGMGLGLIADAVAPLWRRTTAA